MRSRRRASTDPSEADDGEIDPLPERSPGGFPASWAAYFDGTVSPGDPDPALLEFERLEVELRPRRSYFGPTRAEVPESPYIEERLALAQATAANLGREIAARHPMSMRILQSVASLETELDRARRELEFIRARDAGSQLLSITSEAPSAPAASEHDSAPRPRALASDADHSRWGRRGIFPPPGIVANFTVGRYNRTIGQLKGRRRKLAGMTLALAVIVSVLLVGLTLSFRMSSPPLWIELLPAIWLVSVPFFVLSFRGTQRVLRRNHLELSGET